MKYPRRDVTLEVGAHREVKERIIREHIHGSESLGLVGLPTDKVEVEKRRGPRGEPWGSPVLIS